MIEVISSNGNFNNLKEFLEDAFLCEGNKGFRSVHDDTTTSSMPQLVGFSTMYGYDNNLEDAKEVIKLALDNSQHKLDNEYSNTNLEDVEVIVLDDNEISRPNQGIDSITFAELTIMQLDTTSFKTEELSRINKDMLRKIIYNN